MTAGPPVIWGEDKKQATFDEICSEIASGKSLNSVLKNPDKDYPVYSTFMGWILNDPELEKKYARAVECRTEVLADEIVDLSDERPQAYKGMSGEYQVDPAWVSYQKQRVDARKWIASKLKPKKYGDALKLQGDKENPIEINHAITPSERARKIASICDTLRTRGDRPLADSSDEVGTTAGGADSGTEQQS